MEVSRKKLIKFMLNDDIDGLAEYINILIDYNYDAGYTNGYNDAQYESD